MHDVTEGGIAGALWEVAEASNVGMVVIESEIPRFWESTRIAERFQMDLLGAIGSGALVLTAPEPATESLIAAMGEKGTDAFVIGRVVSKDQGVLMVREGAARASALHHRRGRPRAVGARESPAE